ncbi:hypothetical protein SLEP1_g51312 [Rubroshorea leprosula]|uniref:Uncharacterized protein n=1 Tax=Rubroshorea leprosula TaxID=152421 RepID=A0AAV5M2Z3_9ROSI|nr:hypothetical protein SLEP1_g51312 [Rubroshorea leprosula]
MEAGGDSSFSKASSLRWRILRRAILPRASPQNLDEESQSGIRSVSRKATKGFNLIPFQLVHEDSPSRDAVCAMLCPLMDLSSLF